MSETTKRLPSLQPLTPERHGKMGWQRFTHYGFARSDVLAPLAAAEVVTAALSLPIAFLHQGDGWQLVAVLGLLPGQNLFIAPDGHWSGGYVPAALRSYPFRRGQVDGGPEPILCIDEGSGLLVENGGDPFFNPEGTLTKPVADVWHFMVEAAKGSAQLSAACTVLAEADLFESWPITVELGTGNQQVQGLYRTSEKNLNSLNDEAFIRLRRLGLLPLLYAQMLSAGHMVKMCELAAGYQRRVAEAERKRAAVVLSENSDPFASEEILNVDWSRFRI
jgi:hypothetical protein